MTFLLVDGAPANIWSALPSLVWFAFGGLAILVFRRDFAGLLQNLSWRLRTGAALKLFSLELGQSYVRANMDSSVDETSVEHCPDKDGQRYKQREGYYRPNRNIHPVHRIAPSKHRGMLYDIQIYLLAHKGATLINVNKDEYYFGRHWGSQVFVCIDRARNFAITTSAFGPFMCTAELFFSDGESVIINRYIDFEMGGLEKAERDEPSK